MGTKLVDKKRALSPRSQPKGWEKDTSRLFHRLLIVREHQLISASIGPIMVPSPSATSSFYFWLQAALGLEISRGYGVGKAEN